MQGELKKIQKRGVLNLGKQPTNRFKNAFQWLPLAIT